MHSSRHLPPPLNELQRRIRAHRAELVRLGAKSVGIFGSCARGEQREGSDIDVIVDLQPGHGYFDLAEMANILRAELQVEVNLVPGSGVSPGSAIQRERVRVF
jgi:uncharacterized protein